MRELEAALRETTAVIPDEKDPQDVLRNLHELASDSLLDIASFKPKPIVAKPQYTRVADRARPRRQLSTTRPFFDRIATMSRLMSVSDLKIKTQTAPNGRGTVTVSCVATTFVFKKDPALQRLRRRPAMKTAFLALTAALVAVPAAAQIPAARAISRSAPASATAHRARSTTAPDAAIRS